MHAAVQQLRGGTHLQEGGLDEGADGDDGNLAGDYDGLPPKQGAVDVVAVIQEAEAGARRT